LSFALIGFSGSASKGQRTTSSATRKRVTPPLGWQPRAFALLQRRQP